MGNAEFCQVACLMMFCVPSLDPVSKITAMSAASITDNIVSLMRLASFLGVSEPSRMRVRGAKSAKTPVIYSHMWYISILQFQTIVVVQDKLCVDMTLQIWLQRWHCIGMHLQSIWLTYPNSMLSAFECIWKIRAIPQASYEHKGMPSPCHYPNNSPKLSLFQDHCEKTL